jgi:hypothetical protein
MGKQKKDQSKEELHLVEGDGVVSVTGEVTDPFVGEEEVIKTPPEKEKATTRLVQDSTRLEVVITDQKLLEYSRELTEHIREKAQAEDTLKSFKSQMKSEIDSHIAQINLLSGKIQSGKEFEQVDIEIYFDYNTRIKTFTRKDTGQVYKTESIRQDELQLHLDLEDNRIEKENFDKNNP